MKRLLSYLILELLLPLSVLMITLMFCSFAVVKHSLSSSLNIKVAPHLSKIFIIICFNDSPSKMVKNAFYFILKALFVLKIFKFLS